MGIFDQKVEEIKESLFVAAPAIVQKTYPEKQRADVKIKYKKKDLEPPKILDIPISHKESSQFSERQLPNTGDTAWVVFANRALDKVMQDEEVVKPDHDRVLDINDCFLAGEWSIEQEGISAEIGAMTADDWLIGFNRGTNSRLYMRPNGDIVIHPDGAKIELVESAKYSVPLFELVQQIYNVHTHTTAIGPSGPPIPQLTSMQKSDKVKVD